LSPMESKAQRIVEHNHRSLLPFIKALCELALEPQASRVNTEGECHNPCYTLLKRCIQQGDFEWFATHLKQGSGVSSWAISPHLHLQWITTPERVVYHIAVVDPSHSGAFHWFVEESRRLVDFYKLGEFPFEEYNLDDSERRSGDS
jgi:hypothetical protein